jgi:hypothetical protein
MTYDFDQIFSLRCGNRKEFVERFEDNTERQDGEVTACLPRRVAA